jgi:hypothetical protein
MREIPPLPLEEVSIGSIMQENGVSIGELEFHSPEGILRAREHIDSRPSRRVQGRHLYVAVARKVACIGTHLRVNFTSNPVRHIPSWVDDHMLDVTGNGRRMIFPHHPPLTLYLLAG